MARTGGGHTCGTGGACGTAWIRTGPGMWAQPLMACLLRCCWAPSCICGCMMAGLPASSLDGQALATAIVAHLARPAIPAVRANPCREGASPWPVHRCWSLPGTSGVRAVQASRGSTGAGCRGAGSGGAVSSFSACDARRTARVGDCRRPPPRRAAGDAALAAGIRGSHGASVSRLGSQRLRMQ